MTCSTSIKQGPTYLDLFAGAGGLSEGFYRAGFKPVAHIEMDVAACFTLKTRMAYHWLASVGKLDIYKQYLSQQITREEFYDEIPEDILNTVLNYEISENSLETIFSEVDQRLESGNLDLIVGGPPCQAYSIVGRSRSESKMIGDKRNYLYKLYAEFLKRYKPKCFVFENVVGLLSAKEEDGTNVAITRARSTLVVIGDYKYCSGCNIQYLRQFANYYSQLEKGAGKKPETGTSRLTREYPDVSNPSLVSEWEKILYTKLFDAGIKTEPQHPADRYSLDLAIIRPDGRKLDIEVDGEMYHRSWSGELCYRDQLRNQRLFELGWDVMRFWVFQIRDDMDWCIQQVQEWCNRTL